MNKYYGSMSNKNINKIVKLDNDNDEYQFVARYDIHGRLIYQEVYLLRLRVIDFKVNPDNISNEDEIIVEDYCGTTVRIIKSNICNELKVNDTIVCLGCLYRNNGFICFSTPIGYYIDNESNKPLSTLEYTNYFSYEDLNLFNKLSNRIYYRKIVKTNYYEFKDDLSEDELNNICIDGRITTLFNETPVSKSSSLKANPNYGPFKSRKDIINMSKVYIVVKDKDTQEPINIYKMQGIPSSPKKDRERLFVKNVISKAISEIENDYKGRELSMNFAIANRSAKYFNEEHLKDDKYIHKKIYFLVDVKTFNVLDYSNGYMKNKNGAMFVMTDVDKNGNKKYGN